MRIVYFCHRDVWPLCTTWMRFWSTAFHWTQAMERSPLLATPILICLCLFQAPFDSAPSSRLIPLACFDVVVWLLSTGAAGCGHNFFLVTVARGRWQPLRLCLRWQTGKFGPQHATANTTAPACSWHSWLSWLSCRHSVQPPLVPSPLLYKQHQHTGKSTKLFQSLCIFLPFPVLLFPTFSLLLPFPVHSQGGSKRRGRGGVWN